MSGTTYQTTPGVWQIGSFFGTANQVNGLDAANAFRLALIQLESGTVATPFEGRSIQEELALCQRYYETGTHAIVPYFTAGGFVSDWVSYKCTKRAVPTIARVDSVTTNISSVQQDGIDNGGFRLTLQAIATGGLTYTGTWNADAEL